MVLSDVRLIFIVGHSGEKSSEERISKNAKAAKTITIVKSTILFF